MLSIILLLISFLVLWKSADYFVDASHSLAIHFKMPPILIGATVVAFGTSAPELFVTMFAAHWGQGSVVYGNIFGSNIANIFLIFGVSLCLKTIVFNSEFRHQLWLNILALSLVSMVLYFYEPTRWLAAVLLLVFFGIQISLFKKNGHGSQAAPNHSLLMSVLLFLVSLAFLIVSSRLLVASLLTSASYLGLSTTFLSLFAVAFGTSLPELVTTISFVRQGHVDIVLGNVFGSNLFNLMFVLPIAWLVNPVSILWSFSIEVFILFFITLLLLVLIRYRQSSRRFYGYFCVTFYVFYIVFIYYFVS